VVFLLVDTLRADALGAWGGPDARTPWIDRLARGGTSYIDATSPSSWTLPAAASLLTGRYPSDHGATDFRTAIPPQLPIAAEIFRGAGYRTAAVVSHHFVGSPYGFDRGFDLFDESESGDHEHISSPGVTNRGAGWIHGFARTANPAPFFVLCHYFDPHWVYQAHTPWIRPGATVIHGPRGKRERYDSEVRFTDAALGRLIRSLAASTDPERLIIAFVADHGEAFGDHGHEGHTDNLYQELVHVPMVLRVPGRPRNVLDTRPVSTAQILPTLLELCDVAADLPLPPLRSGDAGDPVVSEVSFVPNGPPRKPQDHVAIRRGRWKLIHDRRRDLWELYDLVDDPGELRDVSAELPEEAEALRAELTRWAVTVRSDRPPPPQPRSDDTIVENLRALGYVD
jgi:arylsulfatase A-like enzyme